MAERAKVFEKTCNDYLAEIGKVDLAGLPPVLGGEFEDGAFVLPYFGRTFRITGEAVIGPENRPPNPAISVVLSKYILMRPLSEPLPGDWRNFRDFRDAAPLIHSFAATVEKKIAADFTGRTDDLVRAGRALGATPFDGDVAYDAAMVIPALPKVPVALLFNDRDGTFPARATVLFAGSVEKHLDMECVAMVGMMMAAYLNHAAGSESGGEIDGVDMPGPPAHPA